MDTDASSTKKKKMGRPKGAKNKPKTLNTAVILGETISECVRIKNIDDPALVLLARTMAINRVMEERELTEGVIVDELKWIMSNGSASDKLSAIRLWMKLSNLDLFNDILKKLLTDKSNEDNRDKLFKEITSMSYEEQQNLLKSSGIDQDNLKGVRVDDAEIAEETT